MSLVGSMKMKVKPTYEELERRVQELEKIESDYRSRESQLRLLYDKAPLGYQSLDKNGHFIDVNKTWLDALGYEKEEVIGKPFANFLHPDWRDHFKGNFPRFKAIGEILGVEFEMVKKDGDLVLVSFTGKISKDEEGNFQQTHCIFDDITDRKQAENELKTNYELLQIASETAKFGGWSVDLTNNICMWSDAVADIHEVPHGYAPPVQEAVNFYAPEWQKKIKQVFSACLKEGTPYDEEMEIITKKGKRLWVRTTGKPVKNDKNEIVKVHGSFQDITDKKHTEKALKQSEERFNLAMDASRDGIYEWDLETREIYYSPGWKRMLGYEPEELPNDFSVWEKLCRPEDVEKSWQILKEVLEAKRKRFEVEFEMQHKEGHWVHILSRSNIYKDANGKPVRVVGTHVDITDSKNQRERLKQSESRYKKAQAQAKVGNWEYDLKTTEFWGSDEAKKIYGFDPDKDSFSTEEVESCVIEWERVHQAMVDLVEKGKPYNLEFDIITKDTGKTKTIASIAEIETDGSGQPVKVSGVIHDITERKRTEEELRKRESQLQRIFEILPIGLWFADKEGTLLQGNRKGIEIWGAEPTVTIAEYGIFKAWHLPSRKPVLADEWALAKTIRSGETIVDELLEIETFDGKRKTIFNYTAPVVDGNGQVDGAIVVNLDISERKVLEDQLRQAQKMESIGRLAGGVAHDFNNMLGVILGHTEMALEETDPASPLYTNLQSVHQAGERSADLTRQLLAFARKQTIAPKVIDINDTVKGVINMLRRLVGENIDLLWHPGRNIQPVKIDPSQIDQLLANLSVNARDAIDGVGKITIETEAKTFDDDYCHDHLEALPGEYVLLEVSDDGCGMDKKTLSQVFEPFFTTKEQGQGTGLGLASVFGMVKQNNGFINVYSEPGQGTTFKIYLPVYVSKSVEVAEKTHDLPVGHGNETILLVEDESAILKMTTTMLERLGYTVVAAATPGEAIRLAHEYRGRIDLLMTDVVMPEMNGKELAKNLLSYFPDLKRLFMSGYTANVIAHHGVLDEGVHFIQKPFLKKDLGEKLREALES